MLFVLETVTLNILFMKMKIMKNSMILRMMLTEENNLISSEPYLDKIEVFREIWQGESTNS